MIEKNFPIILLCGGKSSRMKTDKTLLPFGGFSTLAQFQYKRLQREFEDIFISSKTNKFDFIDNSRIIFDIDDTLFSPLIALKSILSTFKNKKVFILSADTPFVKIQTIKKMIKLSQDFDIVIAKTPSKTHNLCGVFSTSLLPTIDEMLKDDMHKIGFLIKQSSHTIVEFENEDEFLNLNNQEEYQKAIYLICDKV